MEKITRKKIFTMELTDEEIDLILQFRKSKEEREELTRESKITQWRQAWDCFISCADEQKWKWDFVGCPKDIGIHRIPNPFMGWGSAHTLDRFEAVKCWEFLKQNFDLPFSLTMDVLWSWQDVEFQGKPFKCAVGLYQIDFSPDTTFTFSGCKGICLAKHELADLRDMFSVLSHMGLEHHCCAYSWNDKGVVLTCDTIKKAAKVGSEMKKIDGCEVKINRREVEVILHNQNK